MLQLSRSEKHLRDPHLHLKEMPNRTCTWTHVLMRVLFYVRVHFQDLPRDRRKSKICLVTEENFSGAQRSKMHPQTFWFDNFVAKHFFIFTKVVQKVAPPCQRYTTMTCSLLHLHSSQRTSGPPIARPPRIARNSACFWGSLWYLWLPIMQIHSWCISELRGDFVLKHWS